MPDANFAFLMADDMRRAVLALPWVKQRVKRLSSFHNIQPATATRRQRDRADAGMAIDEGGHHDAARRVDFPRTSGVGRVLDTAGGSNFLDHTSVDQHGAIPY